jgi:hypothetical protein
LVGLSATAVVTLSACESQEPVQSEKAAPTLEAKEISASIFAANAPDGVSPDKWPSMAKARCGAAAFCQVYIWEAGTSLPGAMPFTGPEVAGIRYRYAINRNTGYEESLWDCKTMPQPDPITCLADPE